ncbi:MAG: hypothetical protein Q9160_006988 [Pyrenula sp. 1 TL-2023]
MPTAPPEVPDSVSSGVFSEEGQLQVEKVIKLLKDGAQSRGPGFSKYNLIDKLDPQPNQILTWHDCDAYPYCTPSANGGCRQYQWHVLCTRCNHLVIEAGRMIQCDHFAAETKRDKSENSQKWYESNGYSLECNKAKELRAQGDEKTQSYHKEPVKVVDRVVPQCHLCMGASSETASVSTVRDDGLTRPIAPYDKHKKMYFPRVDITPGEIKVPKHAPAAIGAAMTDTRAQGNVSSGGQAAAGLRSRIDRDSRRRQEEAAGRTQAAMSTSTSGDDDDDDDDELDPEGLGHARLGG